MPTVTLPRAAVAALFLERQHLARPRAAALTAARSAPLRRGRRRPPARFDQRARARALPDGLEPLRPLRPRERSSALAYGRRLLFEYWAHAACLVPASHAAVRGGGRCSTTACATPAGRDWLRRTAQCSARCETAIRANGPLAQRRLRARRARGRRGGWWNWKPAAHALDYLWMSGALTVHSRAHFQKRFDLASA